MRLRKLMITRRSTFFAAALLLVVGLWLHPGPASAQSSGEAVKPYVILLFDTSGSMIWPVCYSSYAAINGDNSSECPGSDISCSSCNSSGCGNGKQDDTRLYKVKQGAHSVVNAFGEVTFGLARFHNIPASFTCNADYYGRAGGWKGVNCSGGLGTGGNKADILVDLADNNQRQVLLWMNNCDDYPTVGNCPGQLPPASGCNLCSDCGGGCDLELRGVSATPIAGSLYTLRNYINSTVLPGDSKSACRPYKVILLTDGQESCGGNPANEAKKLYQNAAKSVPVHVIGFGHSSLATGLTNIAKSGGTNQAVVVDNEVSLALAMANIISESIMVEECNNGDDDCDGKCDENWPEVGVTGSICTDKRQPKTCTVGQGICQRTGVYVCKKDGTGSECDATAGQPGTEVCNGLDDDCDGQVDEGGVCSSCIPQPEVCDGKDNDCDTQIDEDFKPVACGSNLGACTAGTTACVGGKVTCVGSVGPQPEVCDGKDNNCDGVTDKMTQSCYPGSSGCDLTTGVCKGQCRIGVQVCTAGKWGSCIGAQGPVAEVCNGKDDNCDGQVDEGVGSTCTYFDSTSKTCKTLKTCSSCPAKLPEVCDGYDNDCNGTVDDNVAGLGSSCGNAIGECTNGTWACTNGKLVCQGGKGPSAETCDCKDNDCNGQVDDNVPGTGQPCGESKGECKQGAVKCVSVGGTCSLTCVGGVGKSSEICDCKDNDCDGQIDEDATCPGKAKCIDCKCVLPCTGGEFSCPGGTKCQNGYCVPDKCAGVTCKNTEWCRDGTCVSKCAGITCKAHEKCEPTTGQCVDDSCVTKGCPSGQSCVNYKCVTSPCPPGKCPDGQMCVDGKCYDVCANVSCKSDEICMQGRCVKANPCDRYLCPDNHTCKVVNNQPTCEPDPCRVITCKQGQICKDASCVPDPCLLATCPKGYVCTLNKRGAPDCLAGDKPLPMTRQMVTSGGGGFACSVGDRPGAPPWGAALLLALGLLVGWRRRRG